MALVGHVHEFPRSAGAVSVSVSGWGRGKTEYSVSDAEKMHLSPGACFYGEDGEGRTSPFNV